MPEKVWNICILFSQVGCQTNNVMLLEGSTIGNNKEIRCIFAHMHPFIKNNILTRSPAKARFGRPYCPI